MGFDGSPVHRGAETARFPGCLKSESEERETWTAESLRAASSGEDGIEKCPFARERPDETSAVLRFKVHRTGRASGPGDGPRQGSEAQASLRANVSDQPRSNLIQLESLILAQSERWRQA